MDFTFINHIAGDDYLCAYSSETNAVTVVCKADYSIWRDNTYLILVRDKTVCGYDMQGKELFLMNDSNGSEVTLDVQFGTTTGIYSINDGNILAYATKIEEKILGIIPTGYYRKKWVIQDVQTGEQKIIGSLDDGYDDLVIYGY